MKRMFDILLGSLLLVVFTPVIVAVYFTVRVKMGCPVLFCQERPGLNCRLFKMVKFRTMSDARSANGTLLADHERLTRVGRFLRRTSLDELPELFNVLKGDMSLVGPRPLLVEYLDRYTPAQARRHEMRPGITGWAQVNGRNAISWEKKFELDVWYIDNHTLWLDVKILCITLIKALRREGINQDGQATMEKYMGPR